MYIFITGTAGFIGSFLAETLAKRGHEIYGIDSINDYYDVNLKRPAWKKAESIPSPTNRRLSRIPFPAIASGKWICATKKNWILSSKTTISTASLI